MAEYPLQRIINNKKETLWLAKSSCLSDKKEAYFARATMNIMANEDLAKIANTEPGALSILIAIGKALQVGVQIGGIVPQAHLIPFGNNVELCVTAEGYKFIALSDPPILKDFYLGVYYEGDSLSINEGTGEVDHKTGLTDKKRRLMGVYCKLTELNGSKRAKYMSRGEIEEVRDKFSKQPNGKAWIGSFDQMAVKVAGKRFLKPYTALKEAFMMLEEMEEDSPPDNRGIEDRCDDILTNAIPVDLPAVVEPITEPTKKVEKKTTPKKEEKEETKEFF